MTNVTFKNKLINKPVFNKYAILGSCIENKKFYKVASCWMVDISATKSGRFEVSHTVEFEFFLIQKYYSVRFPW